MVLSKTINEKQGWARTGQELQNMDADIDL